MKDLGDSWHKCTTVKELEKQTLTAFLLAGNAMEALIGYTEAIDERVKELEKKAKKLESTSQDRD